MRKWENCTIFHLNEYVWNFRRSALSGILNIWKYSASILSWSAMFPWPCSQVSCREGTRWNCHDLIVGVSSDQWVRIVAAAAGAETIRGVTGLSVPGDSLPLSAVYRIISLTHDMPIAILGLAELKTDRVNRILRRLKKTKKRFLKKFQKKTNMILFWDSSFT